MKQLFLKTSLAASILAASCFVNVANADMVLFYDRADFEAYVSNVIVDDMETVASGYSIPTKTTDSGDFSWTMVSSNCENGSGCASSGSEAYLGSLMDSATDDFIATQGDGVFNFTQAITSFGFQFSRNNNQSTTTGSTKVTLNGYISAVIQNGSFFGIASDDGTAFTSVTYDAFNQNSGFDDVSYSLSTASQTDGGSNVGASDVSSPSALAFFALGLMGFASRLFKK
jgi:hypothetical protein